MKAPLSDDDLRRRVQELGRRESASAPDLDDLLQRARAASSHAPRRAGLAAWPAAALCGVLLLAAVIGWPPTRPEAPAPIARAVPATPAPPLEDWTVPTDGLLADGADVGGTRDVERLSLEIEGLLR
jgi:hypothetical protein